jgi:hypothetical protein
MQTPVDMTAYSSQTRANDTAPSVVQPRATIVRRPSLEVPLPTTKAVAVGQTAPADIPLAAPSLPGEFDLDLEVPAFLRRNEG